MPNKIPARIVTRINEMNGDILRIAVKKINVPIIISKIKSKDMIYVL